MEMESSVDDFVAITFTVSPRIREIAYHKPESLPAEEYCTLYRFSREARVPTPELTQIEYLRQNYKAAAYLGPGETNAFDFEAGPGWLLCVDDLNRASCWIGIEGEPRSAPSRVAISIGKGKMTPEPEAIPAGRVRLEAGNRTGRRGSIFALWFPPDYKKFVPKRFDPFLNAKRLFSTQAFRDLFHAETIKDRGGLGVRDLTILFTDLKGSTALYERIGDLKAFALVRQHFDRLGRAVARNSGAVVKTIGDAVMASFLTPLDGVRAALAMRDEIRGFSPEPESNDFILKIGLHQGAAIAVTLNDRLDYFGHTVNVAARVPGLADSEEIFITQNVYDYPGVADLLRSCRVSSETARLKGIGDEVRVYKVARG